MSNTKIKNALTELKHRVNDIKKINERFTWCLAVLDDKNGQLNNQWLILSDEDIKAEKTLQLQLNSAIEIYDKFRELDLENIEAVKQLITEVIALKSSVEKDYNEQTVEQGKSMMKQLDPLVKSTLHNNPWIFLRDNFTETMNAFLNVIDKLQSYITGVYWEEQGSTPLARTITGTPRFFAKPVVNIQTATVALGNAIKHYEKAVKDFDETITEFDQQYKSDQPGFNK